MAIVTRYFGAASAGTADGTSWANRDALFSGGSWSSVITGFSFAGSDSLLCYVGPGSYAIASTLAPSSTNANPISFHGCDSSGVELAPPDPDWVSAAAEWDDSGLPVLSSTTNMYILNGDNVFARLMKFTASGITTSPVNNKIAYDWCSITQSTSNTGAIATSGQFISNAIINMTGTSYKAGCVGGSGDLVENIRVTGVSATSGNRDGIDLGNNTDMNVIGSTFVDHDGRGITSSGGAGAFARVHRCSCINNGGDGIRLPATASQSLQYIVTDCLLTGNGGYGLNAQSAAHVYMTNNRYRDNTSGTGSSTWGNYPSLGEYTTDDADGTEFVSAAGGDYRIVNTAATWGGNYGAGDGPPAGGGGGSGRRSRGRLHNV